jgi:hypothetical protein
MRSRGSHGFRTSRVRRQFSAGLMKPTPHVRSALHRSSISAKRTTAWSESSDATRLIHYGAWHCGGTLPVSVKDATRRRVRRAAELKSKYAIAYADAFAVATAVEFNAILLTGDPEIEPLEGEQNLKVQWLSQKP